MIKPYEPIEHGPLSRILSYSAPLTLVVPRSSVASSSLSTEGEDVLLALARRLAHNLLSHLGIDCDIVSDEELLASLSHPEQRDGREEGDAGRKDAVKRRGYIIFGGPPINQFAEHQLRWDFAAFPIQFNGNSESKGAFSVKGRMFEGAGIGMYIPFFSSVALPLLAILLIYGW